MILFTKRILLFGLLLLLNACIYPSHHLYGGGNGHAGHYRSHDNHHDNRHHGGHNYHGDKHRGRRHH